MFLSDKYLYMGTYMRNVVKKDIMACFVPIYDMFSFKEFYFNLKVIIRGR